MVDTKTGSCDAGLCCPVGRDFVSCNKVLDVVGNKGDCRSSACSGSHSVYKGAFPGMGCSMSWHGMVTSILIWANLGTKSATNLGTENTTRESSVTVHSVLGTEY